MGGLEIVRALHGRASAFAGGTAPAEAAVSKSGVLDVTTCLMAKVRRSRLSISDTSKASLMGFTDPGPADGRNQTDAEEARALYVQYRFGGVEHSRVFGDREAVLLP